MSKSLQGRDGMHRDMLIMDLAGRDISVAKSGQTILQPCDVSFHVND